MNGEMRGYLSAAKAVIAFAGDAARFLLHSKVLLFGALAALLPVGAVAIFSGNDMPPMTANGTLKCYGSAGNYEPCVTSASASPSQLNGRIEAADAPASWTTTTLYQQARWATTTAAADEPVNREASPAASQRSNTPAKHSASTACRRKLIPCFFSALRRGLTHIASAAANLGQARPPREHL